MVARIKSVCYLLTPAPFPEPVGMSPKESAPEEEVLVSGGIDDIVRVWTYRQGELTLKHQLTDHSLGVSTEEQKSCDIFV